MSTNCYYMRGAQEHIMSDISMTTLGHVSVVMESKGNAKYISQCDSRLVKISPPSRSKYD